MKAMLSAFAAIGIVSIAAWYGLGEAGFSAEPSPKLVIIQPICGKLNDKSSLR